MLSGTGDVSPVGNSDFLELPQVKVTVAPLIPDDVPGPPAVLRAVARIMAHDRVIIKVFLQKLVAKILKPDFSFVHENVAIALQLRPGMVRAGCVSGIIAQQWLTRR